MVTITGVHYFEGYITDQITILDNRKLSLCVLLPQSE
jgi:hypothetical protein